ncbi:G-protein coupled receptor moody [Episyrphus balteatus]|uniref:G-protein coupled receptor moody n=1 Tax=Episyrphus balteatus TaxID=286459 RepID=UPI002485280D|nr:G-protein coupled receptor moody [Episyrphus balteatus]XP_055844573.1 G-protein coupled receptor moody [Episyrphus balteatus]XP_055844574.1 G-protein coupled receptor moody [Episyrphus balteatus]
MENGELFYGYSEELLTFASVMCIVFILIGIPGNLITILALSKCNRSRNATAICIINLSLSDLLFCCFNLPLAASTFLQRSWNHGNLLCRLFPLMRYGLLAVSLFTVLLITVNRYIMIGHPRIYQRVYRNRNLAIMIAATWIGAFLILIPTYRGIWGSFGLDIEIGSCSILPDENGNSPKEILFIMAFVVPCLCIIVCYARIFYIVRKAALRSREPVNNTSSSMRAEKTKSPLPEQNHLDEQPKELNRNMTKSENSQQSNTPISSNDSEKFKEHQNHWEMRPYLSRLRDDDLKYIDSSVESDYPPTQYDMQACDKPEKISNVKESGMKSYEDLFEEDSGYVNEVSGNPIAPLRMDEALITEVPLKTNDISGEINKKGNRCTKSLKTSFNQITKRKYRNNSTINTSNTSVLYPGRMSKKDRRLLKMISVIFLSFIICYLPITITKIWKEVTEVHWINISGYLLIYLSTCINPIIYVVMSSEYRQAYWNLLLCKMDSKSPHRYTVVTKKPSNLRMQP